MFWRFADELYRLARRVMEETNAHIGISMHENGFRIWIQDNGYDKNGKYDGSYGIHKEELLQEITIENYEAAREHLERLLKENV